ncbi:MAG: SRPBCC family protein [Ramlibacter sp.]
MIKTTLLSILGLLVLAVAVVAAIASQRPDTFRVARSTTIAAPAEKIFPMINGTQAFNVWNPYSKRDPAMTGTYKGPASGPGGIYEFQSKKAGSGSFEVTRATAPTQVGMRLDMTAPFEGHNQILFTLAPRGPATEVTWAMEGPAPFLSKFMGVIFNMDKMIGTDFEAGLADLKANAEKT